MRRRGSRGEERRGGRGGGAEAGGREGGTRGWRTEWKGLGGRERVSRGGLGGGV